MDVYIEVSKCKKSSCQPAFVLVAPQKGFVFYVSGRPATRLFEARNRIVIEISWFVFITGFISRKKSLTICHASQSAKAFIVIYP